MVDVHVVVTYEGALDVLDGSQGTPSELREHGPSRAAPTWWTEGLHMPLRRVPPYGCRRYEDREEVMERWGSVGTLVLCDAEVMRR